MAINDFDRTKTVKRMLDQGVSVKDVANTFSMKPSCMNSSRLPSIPTFDEHWDWHN
jgi:hypothetical protein